MNDFCLRINTGTSNYRSKGGILGKKILFFTKLTNFGKKRQMSAKKKFSAKSHVLFFRDRWERRIWGLEKGKHL